MRPKYPDLNKLESISPAPEKGEIVQTPLDVYVNEIRAEMLADLSQLITRYPHNRKILDMLCSQLRGSAAKNDDILKDSLKETIARIESFYTREGSITPEARQFFNELRNITRGKKTEYSTIRIYLTDDYGWDQAKKIQMLKRYKTFRGIAGAVLKDLKEKFPGEPLPTETTIREYLNLK